MGFQTLLAFSIMASLSAHAGGSATLGAAATEAKAAAKTVLEAYADSKPFEKFQAYGAEIARLLGHSGRSEAEILKDATMVKQLRNEFVLSLGKYFEGGRTPEEILKAARLNQLELIDGRVVAPLEGMSRFKDLHPEEAVNLLVSLQLNPILDSYDKSALVKSFIQDMIFNPSFGAKIKSSYRSEVYAVAARNNIDGAEALRGFLLQGDGAGGLFSATIHLANMPSIESMASNIAYSNDVSEIIAYAQIAHDGLQSYATIAVSPSLRAVFAKRGEALQEAVRAVASSMDSKFSVWARAPISTLLPLTRCNGMSGGLGKIIAYQIKNNADLIMSDDVRTFIQNSVNRAALEQALGVSDLTKIMK